MEPSKSVIEVNNVIVNYKQKRALNGLSFTVDRGEIFGFIGPNGAGKTTTIKALLGLIPVTEGTILLHGLSPLQPRSRTRVGFLPEETAYYSFLTPLEILTFYGEIFHIPKTVLKKRIQTLLELVGLSDLQNKLIGTLSKGTVQKIGLAQALINEPETLILDEPTSGLDPMARLELRKVLTHLKTNGRTIFFSSHELSEVELICDSVAMIVSGKLIRYGTLKELFENRKEQSLEQFFLDTIKGNHI